MIYFWAFAQRFNLHMVILFFVVSCDPLYIHGERSKDADDSC